MFGLTRREQRWKAEQKAAEALIPLIAATVKAAAEIRVAEANTDSEELERLRAEVVRLTAALKRANDQAEHFEREWYLRGDQIEAALPAMREYARKNPKHHFSTDGTEQDPKGAHAWLARNELLNARGNAPDTARTD
jgi:hypothetical protein